MEKVYIISRYRADTSAELNLNISIARHFARMIALQGKKPVASHLFYTQFLDDDNKKEREIGLSFGIDDLAECQEFLLVVVDGFLSKGMCGEIAEAARIGMRGSIIELSEEEARKVAEAIV